MKKLHTLILVLALLAIAVVPVMASTVYGTTTRGIVPTAYPGNFVSSDDDQVCYDMSALGYIGEVTTEMRGFKIDPPVDYDDGNISTTLTNGGRNLNWTSIAGTQVLAFIIKGGPNYNVYGYIPEPSETSIGTPPFDWAKAEYDNGLVSPQTTLGKRMGTPQISHYNVCYYPPADGEFTGCTPGYWRNHADRWFGYSPDQLFDDVFGVNYLPGVTLGMAINNPNTYGTFAFHAVAALLNSTGGVPNGDGTTVDYPYKTSVTDPDAEDYPGVIQIVQKAVAGGTTEAAKNLLAAANELGCPLSGTKAVKVQ
jgi:hypothetical protein